ncbi:hypothetical protein ACJMK2_001697 [Sinanodonta woodiana]|uniref:C2H2-type domain-containing protein n=1 Tax=Sinanodonta woodiana TaxID=1069815 RepID=A0ABD3XVB5_SINWO
MLETCWLCNKSYNSKRELKNHMIPAPHGRLVVICPWCYHEERTFKRVIDLKKHCKRHHSDHLNGVPEEFFSENNAFWLSLYPQDYKRLIRSTKWHDPLAIRARVVVLEWVRKITRSTRSKSEWLQGWEAEGRQKSPQSTPTLTNQDQQTNHMMNRFNSATPLSESHFQPDYEDEDASMVEYSPTRPDIGKMIVCEISLIPQNINAIVQQALTKYRALLKDQVLYDPKAMAAIARRMMTLKPNLSSAPNGRFVPLSDQTLTSRKKEIADALGVSQEYIISVSRAISTDWKPAKRVRLRIEEPSLPESAMVLQPGLEPVLPAALVPVPSSQMSSKLSPVRNQCPKISKTNVAITHEKIFTNQARAISLLSQGCMPLFPPSRRDWSSVPEEDISFAIGQTCIKWPPKGWEVMTPDRKLLIWEYTAMALSSAKTGLQFPSQERLDLLDTFNFLALPGTATYHLRKKDQCLAKSRYYTYEVLRQVAKEGGEEPPMKHWLSILEQGTEHRDKDYDSLIQKTDGVNLRLDAD